MKQLSKNNSTLLFIFLTAILVVVAFISYNKILQFNKSVGAVMHSNEVKNEIFEVVSNLKDAEIGQRGYLLTDDSVFLQPFNNAQERSNGAFVALDSLITDNSRQQENLKKLKTLVDERYLVLNKNLIFLKNKYPNLIADSAMHTGKIIMDEVRNQASLMLMEENLLLFERTQIKDRTATITPIFLLLLSLFSILVITLFFFRLQKETAERISITESNMLLQKAKLQIEANENQFRTFVDSIQDLAWIADGDGWVYWYNQRWFDYTGTTLEEMEGWGWQKVHHPDHVEKITELTKGFWKKDEAFELTFPLRRYDGEYCWFLTRGFPVKNADGKVERWIGTNTDITEQKCFTEELELKVKERTEQLLLQNQTFELAESIAKLGSYTWNIKTDTMKYSDNLFRILDCEPQEFVPTFENFQSFIHPDDLQQVINNREQTIQTGVLAESPYRIISKTGTIKYIRSSGRFSYEGKNRLLIGTVQDISQDVAATKELIAKNLELENANVELDSFSYVASHDLQEPLRKIQGFSKRIIDKDGENLSDITKDYFNRINSAAQRMQNLIESLLSFSSTNTTELFFVKTDLNQTLNEVKITLLEIFKEKNAIIESQKLPTVNAIPVQMNQLFLNLIGNSLKYSKPNVTLHIEITAEKTNIHEITGGVNQKGSFWKITIRDNGIGFEQQYENKIFELFQRLHGKTEYEGTGIGLAICKKIVRAHHGSITATGQPGIGSTFTFFLPDNNKL